MRAVLRGLAPFLKLVGAFPLHLAAAFLAALIAEALLTLQPLLLRAFIDLAQDRAAARDLWVFPAFMLAGAVLAYAFDFISVALRYFLERDVEKHLKDVYCDAADASRPEVVQFALWSGISKLSSLALSVSVDFALVVCRIAVILVFLGLGHPPLGLAAFAALAAGAAATSLTTARIGRLSRGIETGTGRLVSATLAGGGKSSLARLYWLDEAQFRLKSVNVMVSFVLFRILPAGVLAWYLAGGGITLGSLASTFLYLSMLRGPYGDLTALLQDSIVSYSESVLFRAELEGSLDARGLLTLLPAGLIWHRGAAPLGAPLSGAGAGVRRVYRDDLPAAGKAEALDALRLRARERSICVYSGDPLMARFAHFIREPDGRLKTALGRLAHSPSESRHGGASTPPGPA